MMKSTLLTSALLATSAMMPVNAALILSINPSFQSVSLGDQASVDLILSGLEDGQDEILSAYDLSVSYDDSILSYASGTFYDLAASLAPAASLLFLISPLVVKSAGIAVLSHRTPLCKAYREIP